MNSVLIFFLVHLLVVGIVYSTPTTTAATAARAGTAAAGAGSTSSIMFADPDLIVEAIDHPDIGVLRSLTFAGVDVNAPNSDGIVPIIMAAVKGNLERIQILVEAGADLNIREADEWTPLMFVASEGWLDIAKYMLYMGASPFYRNSNGMSAYDIARLREHRELAYFLANVELLMALDEADTEVILRALDHGADHSLANGNGFTALLHMCSTGEHDVIVHLISVFGDHYNRKENDGWNCLIFAAFRGDMATLKFLLSLPDISVDDVKVAQRKARGNRQYEAYEMLAKVIERSKGLPAQQGRLQPPTVQVMHSQTEQKQRMVKPVPRKPYQTTTQSSTRPMPKIHHSTEVDSSSGSGSSGGSNDSNRSRPPSTVTTTATTADNGGDNFDPDGGSGSGAPSASSYLHIQNHEDQQKYYL